MLQGTKVVWSNFDQGEEKLDGENVPQYPGKQTQKGTTWNPNFTIKELLNL